MMQQRTFSLVLWTHRNRVDGEIGKILKYPCRKKTKTHEWGWWWSGGERIKAVRTRVYRRQQPRIISSIIYCRQYRHGTKKSSSFLGSRGRLDEPESGSMQPDFMPKARDIVALVQHSPPLNILLMSKMLYF